VAGRQEIENMW